jgi:hypothetical protein
LENQSGQGNVDTGLTRARGCRGHGTASALKHKGTNVKWHKYPDQDSGGKSCQ